MGLASLGLEIGTCCDFLYRVLLLHAILGRGFSGLALIVPAAGMSSPSKRISRWRASPARPTAPFAAGWRSRSGAAQHIFVNGELRMEYTEQHLGAHPLPERLRYYGKWLLGARFPILNGAPAAASLIHYLIW